MARRPIHLEMAGGKAQRQHMWEAIRIINNSDVALTTYTVARRSGQDDEAVRAYMDALAKAGILQKVGTLQRRDATWKLIKDEGVEAPRVTKSGKRNTQGLGIENVWRTLRIMGVLTAAEASVQASVGGVSISTEGARVYLQGLCNAGYVVREGGIPGQPASYRLLPGRYTGPQHPVYQRCTYEQVYDPNLDKVVWSKNDAPAPAELSGLRIEIERLRTLCSSLVAAHEFKAACISEGDDAEETGALRDAYEWCRTAGDELYAALVEGK